MTDCTLGSGLLVLHAAKYLVRRRRSLPDDETEPVRGFPPSESKSETRRVRWLSRQPSAGRRS
jgi:hypothetical protein